MSLFQCSKCGAAENTATSGFHYRNQERGPNAPPLCSLCDPAIGKWHGKFPRECREPGTYQTDREGNLRHKKTGELWP